MSKLSMVFFFFLKQKTAYEMRISDWSSDVCSSDLMTRIFSHPYGGVLSAYGMGLADQIDIRQQTVEQILEPGLLPALESNRRQLEATAAQGLGERHGQDDAVRFTCHVHLKYEGTDTALDVPLTDTVATMQAAFEAEYRQRYSFLMRDRRLVVESISVEASLPGDPDRVAPAPAPPGVGRTGETQ